MIPVQNISGYWTGTITYGRGYKRLHGSVLYFEMNIIQDKETISGTATDTGGFGSNPDPAHITGTIIGDQINFIKQYPSSLSFRKGEIRFDKSAKGPEIHYSGKHNETQNTLEGEWTIRMKYRFLGIFPFIYNFSGTWTDLRKKHLIPSPPKNTNAPVFTEAMLLLQDK